MWRVAAEVTAAATAAVLSNYAACATIPLFTAGVSAAVGRRWASFIGLAAALALFGKSVPHFYAPSAASAFWGIVIVASALLLGYVAGRRS